MTKVTLVLNPSLKWLSKEEVNKGYIWNKESWLKSKNGLVSKTEVKVESALVLFLITSVQDLS